MRVLFVTSECYPLIKTGGLADVAGALPLALEAHGCDVRVLLPAYPPVLQRLGRPETVAAVPSLFGGDARLLQGRTPDGLQVLALDAPHLYARPGNPYLGPDGKDWPDNHFRFAALSLAGSAIGLGRLIDWRPDVVHAHDWQAGLAPAYMLFEGDAHPPSVLTIHNLAFQGLFPATLLADLGLPPASFTTAGLEFYGRIGFLKAGLVYADRLTTVSPTYAREIRTPEQGMGLDGVLTGRADVLSGIVNGIDDAVWDPESDRNIEQPYSVQSLAAKTINKLALQRRFGLEEQREAPLFCVVSRLTEQKGLDLLVGALPALLANGGQLAMLGSGNPDLETAFQAAARALPRQVGVVLGYDEPLSHQMQAGADIIIVPSRFEPCGLTQLYGLRYGTLPIVARVGGLADTVIDANEAALRDGVATGFQFSPVTTEALGFALERACELFADRARWRGMQRRAMTRKVNWSRPAEAYVGVYRKLVSAPARSSVQPVVLRAARPRRRSATP
jgi:starch synthase